MERNISSKDNKTGNSDNVSRAAKTYHDTIFQKSIQQQSHAKTNVRDNAALGKILEVHPSCNSRAIFFFRIRCGS